MTREQELLRDLELKQQRLHQAEALLHDLAASVNDEARHRVQLKAIDYFIKQEHDNRHDEMGTA
jgi:hypothetical protein